MMCSSSASPEGDKIIFGTFVQFDPVFKNRLIRRTVSTV